MFGMQMKVTHARATVSKESTQSLTFMSTGMQLQQEVFSAFLGVNVVACNATYMFYALFNADTCASMYRSADAPEYQRREDVRVFCTASHYSV
eukprot:COSAG02_NODE_2254_length_9348_cov_2.773273_4_plen_93_part_00